MQRIIIPQPGSGRAAVPPGRVGRVVVGCLLAIATGACTPSDSPPDLPKRPPAPLTAARVDARAVVLKQTYVGSVVATQISTVGSPVEGRVVEFLASEGDHVRAKQSDDEPARPLARLRTTSLDLDLAAAKAELRVREAERNELELSEPKEVEQALARKNAAEAMMEFAESRLTRTQKARDRGAASDDELAEHLSAAEDATEVFRERKSAWELAESGLWRERKAQAQARVEVQEQVVSRLEDDLAEHAIFAPFDGYITREHTEVGQWVAKGDPIVEIVRLDDVEVAVPVLESYVGRLETPEFLFDLPLDFEADLASGTLSQACLREFQEHGITFLESPTSVATERAGSRWRVTRGEQRVTIQRREALAVYRSGTAAEVEIAALPGQKIEGEVVAVVPSADIRSRSFPVKVRLANRENPTGSASPLFQPGMFARVTLPVEEKRRLLIPKDALVLEQALSNVWVFEPESSEASTGPGMVKSVAVEVDLRASDDDWIEVLGPANEQGDLPLKPGQLVIVEGNERIIPGHPVNVVKTWP